MRADWMIKYETLETGKRAYGQESLMTLGNGYLGWRGAPVWAKFSDNHYPGLYVAGVFNRTHTEVAGHDVENEDMVNLPNPQLIQLYVNDVAVDFENQSLERQSYIDFENGKQVDQYTVKVAEGLLTLTTEKYVDPINFHQLAFEGQIETDFDGQLRFESLIDGSVLNQNVERYCAFDSKEFDVVSTDKELLLAKTRTTDIELAVAARTRVAGQTLAAENSGHPEILMQAGHFDIKAHEPLSFEKVMVLASSYETKGAGDFARAELNKASLESIKANNTAYWKKVWETGDIVISTDNKDLQVMTRMNIFHIHQAAQHEANQFLDASVGSRGLTGEGYRGHIFWDEIFVVPYYAANEPETARDLLRYRINRLAAAQANAQVDGERGAMFPWQSGMVGDEQAQFVHLNTVNNEWEPDNSRRQRHVSLAVTYNMWVYVQLTGDTSILEEGGLDLLVETTKFWLNKATLGQDGRYHIAGVMGPDEYHEAYPGQEGGIRDNAYTNLMLTWQINWLFDLQEQGFDVSALGSELLEKANLVRQKLFLNVDENGVIEQYDGFFDLKEVDFEAYAEKYGDIHRIDRFLKAEGLSPDDYKAVKQADTLMTIYNLGHQKMHDLVEQLGYQLPEHWLEVNRDYYVACTVHGSTTSRPVFGGVGVQLGETEDALDALIVAIGSDYYDIQGGTTAEGVHIGVMGETLEVIQNEFAGVVMRDGVFSISPVMPDSWKLLQFTQRFRGVLINIEISDKMLRLTADKNVTVFVYGQSATLQAGKETSFSLN
ncbi:glycosyl hydrolase family 65 protein [Lactococcus sp. dk101]|uniref:glycosyl hydrolase family 65 protein n=2 Tax=Lactococcus TaxID=1357 RepID=UPI0011C8E043|nr:glycosyl hydrolase family 65 protein [Lactococcus sp. dk101]MQW23359.1 glycoside hydrolase family 65 protein [Lactococcus sp. dk101]TXK37940.1 glycoside hydrolase family 65 protein [Lactococcus sp. dk310]TXK49594.1 glycoside hydrolase family 65 protein [Lactococcus sp. dk322]